MLRRCSVALALVLGTPALLQAQYFGQNKVQYESFDWKIIQTEHFDVHFYPAEREAAMDAARIAERSYARLSKVLGHRFRERKVIILYASHSDFSQTNTTEGDVGEGTGGFTDFFKQRNIMPLTGAYADIDHVLTHEMTTSSSWTSSPAAAAARRFRACSRSSRRSGSWRAWPSTCRSAG